MAVAMEVAWRGVSLGVATKKRAWGADAEKLMQLMRDKFGEPRAADATLDLLGGGVGASSRSSEVADAPELLALHPEEPLPAHWEKCLDLKTGGLYFVNKRTGGRTSEDPRRQDGAPTAREFLGSKRAEESRSKLVWSPDEESNLELDLNLSTGGSSPTSQGVCTMEMVERALQRTEKAMGKREVTGPRLSGSPSLSSLTSARSEPVSSWTQSSSSSPSTSSSSSTSYLSAARVAPAPHVDDSFPSLPASTAGLCEAESRKADALVMGACTRCLMYVMLHKSDPKCPRCESEVPLDFTSPPPSSKRQRVDTGLLRSP